MMTNPLRSKSAGFSLIEVVMAVALVAIALPTMIGMFSYFSSISLETKDMGDVESVSNAVLLYLENDAEVGFPQVYQWVVQARQDPAQAKLIYTYKNVVDETSYTVTGTPPQEDEVSLLDGRIMVVELLAPEIRILPTAELPTLISEYRKTYIPLKMNIHAVNSVTATLSRATLLESFSLIISR